MITRIFASLNSATTLVAALLLGPLVVAGTAHAEGRDGSGVARAALATSDASAGAAAAQLSDWLDRLVSSDAAAREAAVHAIDQATPAMLTPIAEHLARLSGSADRAGMSAVVADIVRPRPADRDEIAGRLPDGGFAPADDWLLRLMASPAPARAPWRDLASILGLSRLLAKIATTPAVRELSLLFPTYGELLRPDLERQLVVLGDRALPALIEMRRAEAKELRVWALKLLEALGKAIPGEAVQTGDDQLLTEVLRAYGRAHEVDAVRVILSFANSDRRQIREAAREAVLLLGEPGFPALRESYENMMSKKPPDDWAWERTARELFTVFDRSRLTEAYALMDEGLAAYARQEVERAAATFDRALARDPDFTRRAEMAPAYLAFARKLKMTNRGGAMAALRKAMRVDPQGAVAREAESELLVLEARDRADHGVVDEASLRRALELDPDNAEARGELLRLEAESKARTGQLSWYFFGGAALLLLVGGVAGAIAHGRRSAG